MLPLLAGLLAGCTRSEQWVDEAVLHDGRTVDVRRKVVYNFGRGELQYALTRSPDQFSLEAVDPGTGKEVKWNGARDIHPILLDWADGAAYLAVTSQFLHARGGPYGCPDVPYAFLKYDESARAWMPVEISQVPPALRRTNLVLKYEEWFMQNPPRHRLSRREIDELNRRQEDNSRGFFMQVIPADFEAWTFREKKRFATTRYTGDCRPPLIAPADALEAGASTSNDALAGGASTPVTVEVLEVKRYASPLVLSGEQYLRRADRDPAECDRVLRKTDPDNAALDGYRAFVANPARVTMYSGRYFCEGDLLWEPNYAAAPGRVVLVKANAAGEVLYRVSFDKPTGPDPYNGFILPASFKAKEGYLYFEWWFAPQSGSERHVRSITSVRIKEPRD